jgi:hypothetical protein
VRELPARAPTVFVLEDVHWADEATLDVLRLLARRVEKVPALIVATYRDDELDRAHPLRLVVGELATSQTVARLKLAPLSPAAVAQLAEPHAVDADELYRKTAGNPFFVVEALAAHAEERPHTVRDATGARAARRGPTARQLLEAVAVVPPQAELWLLEALAGAPIDGLDECLTSGMLTSEPAGVAFRHELARRAVEESVAPNRRVDLHRLACLRSPTRPSASRRLGCAPRRGSRRHRRGSSLRTCSAARATSLGAHREAAAQHARALARRPAAGGGACGASRTSPSECYIPDQYDEGIASSKRSRMPSKPRRYAPRGRCTLTTVGVSSARDGQRKPSVRPGGCRAARTPAAGP